jgi:hypothetical protein
MIELSGLTKRFYRSRGDTGVRLGGAALVRHGAAWSMADIADRAGSRGDYEPG